jgi:hypothetical protein
MITICMPHVLALVLCSIISLELLDVLVKLTRTLHVFILFLEYTFIDCIWQLQNL